MLFSVGRAGRALRGAALTLCAMLAGCAAAESGPEPAKTALAPSPACPRLYTYAPGFLMVDVAAGSHVTLNPGLRRFPVFCSADQAYAYLVGAVSSGLVPRGDWLIYSLSGGLELARQESADMMILARPARLTDWFPERTLNAGSASAQTPATEPSGRPDPAPATP